METSGGTDRSPGSREALPPRAASDGDGADRRAPAGGPAGSAWREGALTRAAELDVLTDWFALEPPEQRAILAERIRRHIETAREAAEGEPGTSRWFRFKAMVSGAAHERTASNIDAAEAHLLRLAPDTFVCGQIPSLLTTVRAHLRVDDPRRIRMEQLAIVAHRRPFTPTERNMLIACVRASNSEARREMARVRSFRNVLHLAIWMTALAAVGLTVLAFARPDVVPLCFNPDGKIVCPTSEAPVRAGTSIDEQLRGQADGWDIVTVQIVGLMAATVAAAIALRGIRGTTTPYSLPVALALLKLPMGAMTAFLGLLLMRGQFVPGLTALDTPAQIISWAVIFGYAQQVFTRFVDQRAHAVLDQVGAPAPDDRRVGMTPALTDALEEPDGSPLGAAAEARADGAERAAPARGREAAARRKPRSAE
jgi:hypothetical protein